MDLGSYRRRRRGSDIEIDCTLLQIPDAFSFLENRFFAILLPGYRMQEVSHTDQYDSRRSLIILGTEELGTTAIHVRQIYTIMFRLLARPGHYIFLIR
jgi:hypothetical protein